MAAFDDRELTGITDIDRINVVSVTESNRQYSPEVSRQWYVIEELNIDGIVIWQDASGEIYQAEYKDTPRSIHKSFVEYIATFENEEQLQ